MKLNFRKPDKNLRGTLYCNGIRHSTSIEADWEFLLGQYFSLSGETTMLTALGCSTDRGTIER